MTSEKENHMTTTARQVIDQTACDADDVYLVCLPGVSSPFVAQRFPSRTRTPWFVITGGDASVDVWNSDDQVTVVCPLVPQLSSLVIEREEPKPWEVLRDAADIFATHRVKGWAQCTDLADRLEAAHRADQEKAEREKLIEQAARIQVEETGESWGDLSDDSKRLWRRRVRALVDAGWRPAPDCGHPNHGASDHDCGPFTPESDGGAA